MPNGAGMKPGEPLAHERDQELPANVDHESPIRASPSSCGSSSASRMLTVRLMLPPTQPLPRIGRMLRESPRASMISITEEQIA